MAPIPGRQDALLGVDVAGHPILFVRADQGVLEPPLRTARISLQIGQWYSIGGPGAAHGSELLHALFCEASDVQEVDTFLVLAEAFLARHAVGRVDKDALTLFFRSMVRLFALTPARDLQSERQGLWGELFLMSRVRGFDFWATFWHSETTRRFDFSTQDKRVEVKTVVGSERIHHFSHRQIFALDGEDIVIASLLLREEDAGLSLRDLIHQAREALRGSEHYIKLERAIRRAGMESGRDIGPAYDATEAEQALAWYQSADAPHFRMPEPPGVSNAQYRVDLSTAPRLTPDELREWLNLWATPSTGVTTTQAGSL